MFLLIPKLSSDRTTPNKQKQKKFYEAKIRMLIIKKILESLANPKISFGFVVVFHFE
jgi:hypothetical protein